MMLENHKAVPFKKVRTKQQIKELPFVQEVFYEGDDGWWVHLDTRYVSAKMECSMVHEHTIKELCDALNYGVYEKIEN